MSEIDKNRSQDFLSLSILIDFQCYNSTLIDVDRHVPKYEKDVWWKAGPQAVERGLKKRKLIGKT